MEEYKGFPKPRRVKKVKGLKRSFLARRRPVKRKKRVRLPSMSKLLRKADSVFSLWIRNRDQGKCVICGSRERVQNGHLIRRGKRSVRFDEVNCNAQCSSCNYRHEFEPQHYTQWFLRKYGQVVYDDLVDRSRVLKKWKRYELEEIIEKYADKKGL